MCVIKAVLEIDYDSYGSFYFKNTEVTFLFSMT